MPWLVNGQPVPEELIQEEYKRLSRDVYFQNIANKSQRKKELLAAAENAAIDKMLIAQAAANDPRPIDAALLEQQMQQQRAQWGRHSTLDDEQFRQWVESQLRLQRIHEELLADAAKPTPEEVEEFYNAQRENFRKPELFHASHIVKNVNHEQSEEQAEAGIQAALAELERGVLFGEVADKYSDCKDRGGDLGQFPTGHMVEDFENAIRALEPGQRSGVFTTPFGFHIALLHSKSEAGPGTLEDFREGILRVMTYAKQHDAYRRGVAGLRARADIRRVGAEAQPSPQGKHKSSRRQRKKAAHAHA